MRRSRTSRPLAGRIEREFNHDLVTAMSDGGMRKRKLAMREDTFERSLEGLQSAPSIQAFSRRAGVWVSVHHRPPRGTRTARASSGLHDSRWAAISLGDPGAIPLNPILADILSSGTVQTADGRNRIAHGRISEDVGHLLQRMIREQKPKVSIEVGLANGVSALFLCEALTEVEASKHYVIDPNQSSQWNSIGIQNLERAGYGGLIELREEPSYLALPTLLRGNPP